MAGKIDAVEATARIEAALDRLANTARGQPFPQQGPDPRLEDLAARIDYLVTQLREVLAEDRPAALPELETTSPPVEAVPHEGPNDFSAVAEAGNMAAPPSPASAPAPQAYDGSYHSVSYGTPTEEGGHFTPPHYNSWQ
ncbi:hypothetical protein [Granulibacter bethesdensis]|uniref:Uncharacterized protein n=1 Tax=Granulibacter bethesdensis TaxID=364410 RepID=A0AAN0RDT3_9PROT|nr:hypothetical protein [Granulibacter bethesdensis]AHJ62908.1 Hypothetical protein GbCGDNIH3_1092 [Granulibacter bethesdensis]APH59431.1 Hypothetical protein GbCGDNIH7_1092 [Granulibacter bethesdensis]